MRHALATTTSTWRRAQQGVARFRQADTPSATYSPIFCIGLLLTIAFMVSIGR